METISTLRIIGIIVGLIAVFFSFKRNRGNEWDRVNFLMLFMFGVIVLLVSVNPNIVNLIADIFQLRGSERGRILALIIMSIFVLFLMVLYYRKKIVMINRKLSNLILKLSENSNELSFVPKPIMVLIPAYNESDSIGLVLERLPDSICNTPLGVLVIDDGSTDDTASVVIEKGYPVVKNFMNLGQGAASKLGYSILDKVGAKIVVTMDADNQHDPGDIVKLVRPILDGKSDLVIGSRILGENKNFNFVRYLGVKLFTWLINFITGQSLTDCSSGFKAFNIEVLRKIHLLEDQFQSSEFIIDAAKKGFMISEVPIVISERASGDSKKGTNFNYGLGFLKTITKTWWR